MAEAVHRPHPIFTLVPRRLLPLDWHISRLKKKEYYSWVRYGDAEIKALLEDRGGAGGRGKYKLSPQLKKEMNQALLKYYKESTLFYSCPFRMLRIMNAHSRSWLEEHKLIKIKWIDCTVFKGASNGGKLLSLIQELRRQRIIIIGPSFLRNLRKTAFNFLDFIEINPKTGYLDRTVMPQVLKCQKKYGNGLLYSFSMGPGANICIPNLHHKMSKNFLIDFGSVWDVFCGVRSRKYMNPRIYSNETLRRNLGLWENPGKSEEECLKQLGRIEQLQLARSELNRRLQEAKELELQKQKEKELVEEAKELELQKQKEKELEKQKRLELEKELGPQKWKEFKLQEQKQEELKLQEQKHALRHEEKELRKQKELKLQKQKKLKLGKQKELKLRKQKELKLQKQKKLKLRKQKELKLQKEKNIHKGHKYRK